MNVGTKLLTLLFALGLTACYMGEPIPVECVCQCENAKPAVMPRIPALPRRGSKMSERKRQKAATKAAEGRNSGVAAKRAAEKARRAEGRIARQPGSGDILETDERTRKAMMQTYTAFLKGATSRDLATMKPFLTNRLHSSLEKNLPKYEERFFKGLKDSIDALGKGGMTIKETRDMGRGNVEAQLHFANGHERRAIFFKEDGEWKLNRL